MSIINFGSINIDFVYAVQRIVRPGETRNTLKLQRFAGGKGFNQSIALARAGNPPRHVGRVGEDGRWLIDILQQEGVDVRGIESGDTPTGHAIIQVDPDGENSILVHGGANREIPRSQIAEVCNGLSESDWVLVQNETNDLNLVLEQATARGARVVLNPSPMEDELLELPLHRVHTFLINQSEGEALSGECEPESILDALIQRFPKATVVLTLGARGARYARAAKRLHVRAQAVTAVDTTAAGDTFAGYYLSGCLSGNDPERALRTACRAAGHCVSRAGAAASIPTKSELGL